MKAELIDHLGDDLRVVNAARVSFDKESVWQQECLLCKHTSDWPDPYVCPECYTYHGTASRNVLTEKDARLIRYLARNNHWTPFGHCQVTIRETVPIFVARERFRHTVGFVYNEVSRRYVDTEPSFHAPGLWRERPKDGIKQGSGDYAMVAIQDDANDWYNHVLNVCTVAYQTLLDKGIAPEQARMVLPQSMMTSYYVTGSLAAWSRFFKLRTDPHAQLEIQELAKLTGDLIAPLFPVSWAALTEDN